jgi:hypothetical protein
MIKTRLLIDFTLIFLSSDYHFFFKILIIFYKVGNIMPILLNKWTYYKLILEKKFLKKDRPMFINHKSF